MLDEDDEKPERLILQPDAAARLQELARSRADLEGAELINGVDRRFTSVTDNMSARIELRYSFRPSKMTRADAPRAGDDREENV